MGRCLKPPSKCDSAGHIGGQMSFSKVPDPWLVWLILWNGNPISRRCGGGRRVRAATRRCSNVRLATR